MGIEFYDVKHKKKVEIAESHIKKIIFNASNGRTTYGLRGTGADGRVLTKFVGKTDWDKLAVPEEKRA